MYTGILYVTIGILIAVSILLFLLVQVLNAQGRALMKERMRGDMDRLDDLPPPILETAEENEERPAAQDAEQKTKPEAAFTPSVDGPGYF